MNKFGIISEGATDQITIQNILCGFFENEELGDEVIFLLPPTGRNGASNWRTVLKYLAKEDFRNDLLNCDYLILQIDTDVSTDLHHSDEFGVTYDESLPLLDFIDNVKSMLVSKINSGDSDFYEAYAERIIFAISVHSIECWFVAFFAETPGVFKCDELLLSLKLPNKIQFSKKIRSDCHKKLGEITFSYRSNIDRVAEKSISFNHFIEQLKALP